jgi:hypothetical protein
MLQEPFAGRYPCGEPCACFQRSGADCFRLTSSLIGFCARGAAAPLMPEWARVAHCGDLEEPFIVEHGGSACDISKAALGNTKGEIERNWF